jgi:competence protein ComEC
VLIIFCLWFFALLTGASPSVLRAAVMFTFISIGVLSGKRSSIFNSMSISAFVLLCYDPFLLWNVGFQLSYSAVLGIVVCQRSIYNWLHFDKKIPDYAWQLVSVSLAAQVFTIPLCLYYFHQMPLLFVIANLAAIPLCTLAIWSCILLISFSPFAPVAFYAGKIASAFLWLMNQSVLSINKFPFSLWKNISFNIYETLLLFIIIISLIRWFFTKKILTLQLSLLALLSLGLLRGLDQWKAFNQQKIIVYNIPKHSAIDVINGNYYSSISNDALRPDSLLTAYNIKPARTAFRLFSEKNISSDHLKKFMQVNGTRFLLLDSALKFVPAAPIALEFIIVSNGANIKMSDLIQNFSFRQIIFDASNPAWKIRQWKKECEELHLRFHDVSTQGAFIANI